MKSLPPDEERQQWLVRLIVGVVFVVFIQSFFQIDQEINAVLHPEENSYLWVAIKALLPTNIQGYFVAVMIIGTAVILTYKIKQYREDQEKLETGGHVEKEKQDLLLHPSLLQQVRQHLSNDANGVWCGQLRERALFTSVQDRGIVIGPPGTGKTAFLISQLLQWSRSQRPFVCLDIKPEIYAITRPILEAAGYILYVYNPTAPLLGHRYNPLADLHGVESIGELSSVLIPSEVSENAVFNESAREFLEVLILYVQTEEGTATFPRIRSLVEQCSSYRDLLSLLMTSSNRAVCEIANAFNFLIDNERLMGSIFATFRSNLRFLRYPAISESLETSDFSLKALTTSKPVGLFLQFEEKHQLTTGKLLSMMIGHVIRYLMEETHRSAVLLLLDEIGTVPYIEGLPQKLNTLRSRQLPTWLFWQSLEQMQKYGKKHDEGVNMILGACDFQMVFRLNDNASAEYMSTKIGTIDRLVKQLSYTKTEQHVNENISKHLVKEPKIFAHELQQLVNHQVVCTYKGLAWKGHATPYYQLFPDYLKKEEAITVTT